MPPEEEVATEQPQSQVTLERGPGGRFKRARQALPPLEERMAAKEAELAKGPSALPDDEPEAEEGGADEPADLKKPPAAAKPGEPAPKPRRETVDVPTNEPSITQLRLQHTEWARKQREGLAATLAKQQQEHEAKLKAERAQFDEERGKHTPRIEKAERVLKLMESADYESLAKEAGYDDWDKFQGHVLGTLSDPNYKETRALRRELEERKAKEKAAEDAATAKQKADAETAEKQTREQQRTEKIKQHKLGLSELMSKSQDRVVATMADDPHFVEVIFQIQAQNYDPVTDSTVTPEQAIKMALRGAPRSMLEQLTVMRDRLNKALGEAAQQAIEPANTTTAAPKPKTSTSKTAVVPSPSTIEAAPRGKFKGPKDPAWIKYRNERMNEAMDEEEQAKQQQRVAKGGR